MKVLAVLPSLHDQNPGGVQVAGEIAWQALKQHTNAQIFEVAGSSRWTALRAARRVRFACDVIVFWHLDLLKLAPFLPRTQRRVVYLHGIEAWRRRGWLTRSLLRDSTIFANSEHTISRARACIPQIRNRNIRVVQLGAGKSVTQRTMPDTIPAAIMIGRLDGGERYKGHHEVIAAWPRVRREVHGAQLWIVGDGDLRSELEDHATSSGAADAIRFFGRIDEAEKARLIAAARCLVLPSRGEGFGLVYLEAMRAARPCLVGVDAGREVVNPPEAGLAVDPADAASLTSAIVRLMTDTTEWRRMSDAAQRRYDMQFTAWHFQQRLITALQEIG
jgi:phosphatidyl-myo-inositol dimannoside synthase